VDVVSGGPIVLPTGELWAAFDHVLVHASARDGQERWLDDVTLVTIAQHTLTLRSTTPGIPFTLRGAAGDTQGVSLVLYQL
jgi:hypothetical protein